MMSGWAGFTDAELQRLKGPAGKGDGLRPGVRKSANFTKPKVTSQQRKAEYSTNSGVISPEQSLSKPPVPSNNNTDAQTKGDNNMVDDKTSTNLNKPDNNGNTDSRVDSSSSVREVQELELDQSEVLSHQLSKLEKYQQQQKQIEELNKQRKNILSKAISERSKKAKAEATKLKHIEKELSHLDQQLTGGVTIIRDRIEQASIAYLDAQHKYDRAEKEFISAKIDLHEKAELKEQLTEHLYTIIHQNEIRKSQKLAQLMKELEMEISTDETDIKLDLPPLSSFNTMQTLSPSRLPTSVSFPAPKSAEQEPKMADNSATTGSQPPSESVQNSNPQPIGSPKDAAISDSKSPSEDGKQISQNSEQGRELSNSLSHTEQESPNLISLNSADKADTNLPTQASSAQKTLDSTEPQGQGSTTNPVDS